MAEGEGFLGRWSRRKLGGDDATSRTGHTGRAPRVDAEVPAGAVPAPPAAPLEQAPAQAEPAAPPTLEDVAALTPESDFRRFVGSEVDPQVRNAAVKKLFADPHFQAMDGLDVYIDDYSQPDPIPERMLRNLASAETLGLFPPPDARAPDELGPRVDVVDATGKSVPQSPASEPGSPRHDADPDLRLQQDDAPGPAGPGPGPG